VSSIDIETTAAEDGWIFKVEVKNSTSTTHTVTMSKAVYDRLTKAQITPEECVQKHSGQCWHCKT